MKYKIAELEDQIIATLQADTANFSTVMVAPHTGQVSAQMFFNPEFMQDAMKRLPFALVAYQGRTGSKDDRDSSALTYIHTLSFRIYVGTTNARGTKEATRSAYDILAAIYDDLHGHVPLMTGSQQLDTYSKLSGTGLSSTGVKLMSPLFQSGGQDEVLVVNIPGIVVYRTDYSIRMLA